MMIILIVLASLLLDRNVVHLTEPGLFKVINRRSVYAASTILFVLMGVFVIKPPVGWYFFSKGFNEIKQNRFEPAINDIQKAIFWENQNARYHTALANSYFNEFEMTNYYGWVFRSLDELNRGLELNPVDGNYYKLKGRIYKSLAKKESKPENIKELYDKAFTNFEEAIKLLPYEASIYLDLGEIHSYYHRFDEAEKEFQRAMKLEPNLLAAREKKVILLLKTGQKEEAVKEYQELASAYDQIKGRVITETDREFIQYNREEVEKMLKESSLSHL